jgi:uncharacterized repeat protein (TIGR01451 family)
MIGVNRRKSVMGNGRWSGKSLGKTSGKSTEKRLVGLGTLGATFVLLLAGSMLLGFGSRRYAQKSSAQLPASQLPASPLPSPSVSSLKSKREAQAILGQLPLIFEPNQGQADSRVKFLARGAGYSLFLDTTGAVLAMQTAPASRSGKGEKFVSMNLVGANSAATLAGTRPLPGKSNYIVGNDQSKWRSGIPQFAGVYYASVYPGIDLIFYGNQGHLEYDFQVAPGADPSQAVLRFDGASKLKLNGGDLILTGEEDGALRLRAPQIYQRDGERREPVAGHFALRAGNRVGFEIGAYDRARELVIDPGLQFSTYLGGSGSETSPSVAVNSDGFIYVVGSTTSPALTFPLNGTLPTQIGTAPNVFVAKINPALPSSVVYLTFLGGSGGPGADTSIGIGVDNSSNAYIVGNTSSTDFPTSGIPYQTGPETKTQCGTSPTCTSVFVTVLNPTGSAPPIYSSYLSGNGNDQATGMANDPKGDVFITGTTTSNQEPATDAFPATQLPVPFQSAPATGSTIQFFATKVNTTIPGAGGIAYSTYFGGVQGTVAVGGGMAVDTTGNMYFSGTTNFYNSGSGVFGNSALATDFPILNAYQPCLDTPPPVVLANPNPCTTPAGTPVPTDAFVAKLNPLGSTGAQLLFSTYLGGTGADTGAAITIDSGALNIYLTGETNSSDFVIPTGVTPFQLCLDTPPAIPPVLPPCPVITSPAYDAYVARMGNPTQSTTGVPNNVPLTYFSYLGGSGNDSGIAIAVDTSSDALITGATSSTNFPVTAGAFQSHLGTGATQNAFLAHINTTTVVNQNQAGSFVTYFGGNGSDRGTGIAVDPTLNTYFVGDTTSTNLQVLNPLPAGGTNLDGPSDAFVVKLATQSDLCINCVAPILSQLGVVSAGNPLTITFTVANNGPDPATNIAVNGTVPTGVTFNSATASSGTCSAPSGNAVVCQIPTLQSGSAATVAFVVTPNNPGSYQATAQVSAINNTSTNNSSTASFTAGGFTMSIGPSSQTVSAGLPAVYSVNLAPNSVFNANISLSCSALPTGAVCSFNNSTVVLNGNGSSRLTLTTTAQPVTTITSAPWVRPLYAFWLMVPGMALLGAGANGKRRGKKMTRLLGMLGLSVLFALVLLQPSCSSGKTQPPVSGTPSGTYNLSVTATSGSFTFTVPFSLTVTP